MKQSVLISLFAAMLLISCKKESEQPFIVVNPADITIETFEGEKIVFNVNVYSDLALRKFTIYGKYAGETERVFLDSSLVNRNFNVEWAFTAISGRDEDYLLYFCAIDNKGTETKLGKRIRISGNQLQESSGLKMYSYNNGGLSAFNLKVLSPEVLSADSSLRDLQEIPVAAGDEHLTLKVGSPSGCRFVKFNEYDYGNANSLSVKSAFSAGIQVAEISNIKLNDIYLVKIPTNTHGDTYAVLKFTGLFDLEGTADDFYEFSVKK